MRINTIITAALIISLFAGAFAALGVIVAKGEWWMAISAGFFSFGVCFMVSQVVMRKFTIHKLKPIYQRMFSKEIKSSELEHRLSYTDDFVDEIEEEIADWADLSKREIARLKENEQYRKDFVGNVSHELKTPIFNIQGYVTTLLDGGLEDPSVNRLYLERTEKSIDRLINIIVDLEEISKLESGVLTLNPERFDIVDLAKEVIDSLEIDAAQKNIRMVIRGSGNFQVPPIFVDADKHYISQVFVNLVSNSIRYGSEGGRTKIVFIDLFDKVLVEVEDNGPGIDKDDIPRVFERFYRTDKSRSREQGGTGLGLSIVKHILEAHRESITLRSEEGKGSVFSFTLRKYEPQI